MATRARKTGPKRRLKSGLPGSAAEQRRDLRKAIKKHAETLRRLAR